MADPRQEVYDYIKLRLGDGMVDVELDLEHYKSALDTAILTYRQRGANSTEEGYAFLEIQPEYSSSAMDQCRYRLVGQCQVCNDVCEVPQFQWLETF